MQLILKTTMLICTFLCVVPVYAANKLSLDINFEYNLKPQGKVKGGVITKIQSSDCLIYDRDRNGQFLHFNGVSDNLLIDLTDESVNAFSQSFTFEFDFISPRLPQDSNFEHPGRYSIEVFSGLDKHGKKALSFYLNQYNRFTAYWFNTKGKRSQILTTWNHPVNYEVASIQRNKWYRVALVYNKPAHLLEVYLDGEKMGQVKTSGNLATIKQLRFGGNLSGNVKGRFSGGIDNVSLSARILHNTRTNSVACKKSWQRLHKLGNKKLKSFLMAEKPEWANNHPRMMLTPSRIEQMKANLKLGKGPELVKQLVARCDAMLDKTAPEYYKEIPVQSWGFKSIVNPLEFALATIITGDQKYAKRLTEIVMDYIEKRGFYDVIQGTYSSGEGLVRQMMVVTLAYDWSYDYFTPEQRQKLRLFFLNIANGTYTFFQGDDALQIKASSLKSWVANWTAMSVATLGYSSLAIMGETSAKTKLWLDYAIFRATQYGLFAIGMDGCFHEMTDYFAYGGGHIIPFMDSVYTAGGDDLLMASNFAKYTNFLPYVIYPYSKKTMALKYARQGLTGLNGTNSYLIAFLNKKLHTPQSLWCWQRLHENMSYDKKWDILSIIWFQPKKPTLESPNLPLSKWFKSEGVVAFRSDWTKDAIAGIFMAYPAKMAAHDQCDRGQFVLYGYQGRWIIDNGGRGKPQEAWRDAHNLITIDNKIPLQKTRLMSNYHHDAFMTNFCAADKVMTVAEADLTQSYKYAYTWGRTKHGNHGQEDSFKDAQRKIVYMREKHAPNYLLVYDSIQADDKEHEYTLSLHTAPQNEVTISKNLAEFCQYPNQMMKEITYLSWLNDKDASGNYLYTGKPTNGNPDNGYAEYKINVPVAGKYNLYGYACAGEKHPNGMDSFFVKLGQQKTAWGFASYQWSKINKKAYDLPKGESTITVLAREPQAKLIKLALYPDDSSVPLFNKPNNKKLIFVDISKPNKIVKNFVIGTKKVKAHAIEPVKAANMTLWQFAPRNGFTSKSFAGHIRLQVKDKAVKSQFLNFFYPRKPGMQQPTKTQLDDNTTLVKWQDCQDVICMNPDKQINTQGISSDADLVVVRKQGDYVISFVMVNGSYLSVNNQKLIKLVGGKGVVGWADDTLTINGKDVYNFAFHFPAQRQSFLSIFADSRYLKNVLADGKKIEVQHSKDIWQASFPFVGSSVLKW